MRETFLPFARPDLDETELAQIKEALDSGWITTGPKVKQLEEQFAQRVGAKQAVAVNSATAAMHLALEAIGLTRGDEVITTPYTFAATAEVVRYFDAKPVFVDIDPRTFNIRPDLIESVITERTKAIIPVHVAGLPCDLDAITKIARKHDLVVIEDAAHAFPSEYKGRTIGSISDFTCFSFYATKSLTTAEGGMVCTDNDQWADRCRMMALHGISKDAWKRYTSEGSWYYEIVAPGYKYNMTDIAAGMGLAQIVKVGRMWQRRQEIACAYHAAFSSRRELEPPATSLETRNAKRETFDSSEGGHRDPPLQTTHHSWHLYMLRLNLEQLRIDRASFIEELKRRNIGSSVHFIPLHIHPYYGETYGYKPEDFPAAYEQYMRTISLPIYSKMSDSDVQDVIEAVLAITLENASQG